MFTKRQILVLKDLIDETIVRDRENNYGNPFEQAVNEYLVELQDIATSLDVMKDATAPLSVYRRSLLAFKNQLGQNVEDMFAMLDFDKDMTQQELDDNLGLFDLEISIKGCKVVLPLTALIYEQLATMIDRELDELEEC